MEPCTSTSQLENSLKKLSINKNVDQEKQKSSSKNEEMTKDRIKIPILDKLSAAAPYNFFLTTVRDSPETHQELLSVTFTELLDPNLGDLESSLQMNCVVQIEWLLQQYEAMGHRNKPMTLLYSNVHEDLAKFKPFLTSVEVKTPSFGSHHTKMMIFSYRDKSARIVVSTANLIRDEWKNMTDGLWISPRCHLLDDASDPMAGDSQTNFKRDLINYLSAYKLLELVIWIKKLQRLDMSSINVFFIGSVPGTHYPVGGLRYDWGHPRLAHLLNDHTTIPDNNSFPVILQCSSIGSFGRKSNSFILVDMLTTFTSGKRNGVYSKPDLKLIYPSFENVVSSYDGVMGGRFLFYPEKTRQKQEWVTSFMCQWISENRHRTRAPPHIKSYCRVSPDNSKLSYFMLTSANMSRAAWGTLSKGSLIILSYEAGVLFLPQFIFENNVLVLGVGRGNQKEVMAAMFLANNEF